MPDQSTLDALFPLPSKPPSTSSPTALPGATEKSAEALIKYLRENHVNFHCFFNDKGYHNHLSHHLFAAYKLGGTPSLIKAAYDSHADYQRPAFKSPSPIDDKNWKEHLGDENFYSAYLEYFSTRVLRDGVGKTFEQYVFSKEANWGTLSAKDEAKAPQMLNRLMAGLFHPLIHFGHGAEYGIPGMAAEGLAWIAVHNTPATALMPPDFFTVAPTSVGTLTRLTSGLWLSSPGAAPKVSGIHSFDLLARMLEDPSLAPGQACKQDDMSDTLGVTLASRGDTIRQYCKEWACDITTTEELEKRIEELSWLAVLIYGVGGWSKSKGFQADFFLMHLVTSSLFTPSVLALLSPASQSALLRSYMAVTLGYWVSRGRPKFAIKDFFSSVDARPTLPIADPTPDSHTLDTEHLTQNPWMPVVTSTLSHPDEHLLKLERALLHYAALYGGRPKGHWTGTKLEGAEELDGSLFIRVAGLSLKRLGPVREGEKRGEWDRAGFWDWD